MRDYGENEGSDREHDDSIADSQNESTHSAFFGGWAVKPDPEEIRSDPPVSQSPKDANPAASEEKTDYRPDGGPLFHGEAVELLEKFRALSRIKIPPGWLEENTKQMRLERAFKSQKKGGVKTPTGPDSEGGFPNSNSQKGNLPTVSNLDKSMDTSPIKTRPNQPREFHPSSASDGKEGDSSLDEPEGVSRLLVRGRNLYPGELSRVSGNLEKPTISTESKKNRQLFRRLSGWIKGSFRLARRVWLLIPAKRVRWAVLIFAVLSSLFIGWSFVEGYRDAKIVAAVEIEHNIKINDRDDFLIGEYYLRKDLPGGEVIWDKPLVRLTEVPEHFVNTLVYWEDRRFFESWFGVDWRSFFRTVKYFLLKRKIVGGSTITMQLIKNTHPTFKGRMLSQQRETWPQKLNRKRREFFAAIMLSKMLSKEEVLERYLNCVFWGADSHQFYGLKSASLNYFDKEPKELTPLESLVLVAILNAPAGKNLFKKENWSKLKQTVNGRLAEMKLVSSFATFKRVPDSWEFSQNDPRQHVGTKLWVSKGRRQSGSGIRPDLLPLDYDALIDQRFLEVSTTIDATYQGWARDIMENTLSSNYDQVNSAILVMDITSGDVLAAHYRSDGDFDPFRQSNVIQVGSVVKPFAFLVALEGGYLANMDQLEKNRAEYICRYDSNQKTWRVRNATGKAYGRSKRIPLSQVLIQSLNAPFVRRMETIGFEKIIPRLKDYGFEGFQVNQPACLLGAKEQSLFEIASIYSLFPRALNNTLSLNSIQPRILKPNRQQQQQPDSTQPHNPGVGQVLRNQILPLLRRVPREGTAKGHQFPRGVYAKTGTNSGAQHAICIAFNRQKMVITWVNRPLESSQANPNNSQFYGGGLPAKMAAAMFRNIN